MCNILGKYNSYDFTVFTSFTDASKTSDHMNQKILLFIYCLKEGFLDSWFAGKHISQCK